MKVLHFFKTYLPDTMGGIEQVIFQLAEGGRRVGVEAQVLSLSSGPVQFDGRVGGHVVHRARQDLHLASTGFSLSAFGMFKRLSREVDLVHYHFPWPFMDVVHFVSGVQVPSVLTYHSDIVKQKMLVKMYSPLMNSFLRSVDAIVATSPNYLASSPVLQRFENKVSVIPLGIDPETYPAPQDARLDRWRAVTGQRFFLFVGALRYYKGLDFLLDAAKQTGLPVVIVGGGPLEQALKHKARSLGLANVLFLGGLPDEDKSALLQLCSAVVFPSHLRSEAFGVTLLEGAMYGKPMISCEIGTGTTYINIHGETGLVVEPCNASALAAAMQQLWGDPLFAAQLGGRAAIRFEKCFRADTMVGSYKSLYDEVLAK
ncbi:glycosyltransferase family 4 protein [Pseudomonas sp. NPDC090203]|uniref:glycosyltransferase family 4 protein n=1 Tax=Pseudomonas sp. NPDC090203 TaxID=3364477 RepID=UPI00382498EF